MLKQCQVFINIVRYFFLRAQLSGFRIAIGRKTFTPTNTGLDKQSEFPELGSTFKAAFVKACSWYFAKVAIEISEQNPAETLWHQKHMILFSFLLGFSSNGLLQKHLLVFTYICFPKQTWR